MPRHPSAPRLRRVPALALLVAACTAPGGDTSATEPDATTTATTALPGTSTAGPGDTTGPVDPTTGAIDPTTGPADETTGEDTTTTDPTASTGETSSGSSATGEPPNTFLDSYPVLAQFPEGGTYDPTGHAFYVGSLGDGTVHRIDAATGAETVLFEELAPGTWWTLGMDVDVVRRRLWVCAMDDLSPDPRAGRIWIFDLDTDERVADHALADAAADATCTDVTVTSDGTGWVVDREVGNLYRVDERGGPTLFTASPDLEAAFVGQNSLVALPDESALLSLLYLPSGLARIDLGDGSVVPVAIDGEFSDLEPLSGADGMTYADGALHVAFTGKVMTVTPIAADWSSVASVPTDVEDGQTDIIRTPNGLYLLNGQAVTFALGAPPEPFVLVRLAP